MRARVLAVEVEPGLIDAYEGEDLFVEAHARLAREGFWLSDLNVCGAVRMERETAAALAREAPDLDPGTIAAFQRPAPGWCEARYLRTTASLAAQDVAQREYALLWAFAVMDRHLGFALDVARACAAAPARLKGRLKGGLKKLIPGVVRRKMRKLLGM